MTEMIERVLRASSSKNAGKGEKYEKREMRVGELGLGSECSVWG